MRGLVQYALQMLHDQGPNTGTWNTGPVTMALPHGRGGVAATTAMPVGGTGGQQGYPAHASTSQFQAPMVPALNPDDGSAFPGGPAGRNGGYDGYDGYDDRGGSRWKMWLFAVLAIVAIAGGVAYAVSSVGGGGGGDQKQTPGVSQSPASAKPSSADSPNPQQSQQTQDNTPSNNDSQPTATRSRTQSSSPSPTATATHSPTATTSPTATKSQSRRRRSRSRPRRPRRRDEVGRHGHQQLRGVITTRADGPGGDNSAGPVPCARPVAQTPDRRSVRDWSSIRAARAGRGIGRRNEDFRAYGPGGPSASRPAAGPRRRRPATGAPCPASRAGWTRSS